MNLRDRLHKLRRPAILAALAIVCVVLALSFTLAAVIPRQPPRQPQPGESGGSTTSTVGVRP